MGFLRVKKGTFNSYVRTAGFSQDWPRANGDVWSPSYKYKYIFFLWIIGCQCDNLPSSPSVALKEARNDTCRAFHICPNCFFSCMQQIGIFPVLFIPPQSTILIPRHKIEWKKMAFFFYARIQKIKNWHTVLSSEVAGDILREENYFPVDDTFNCKLQNLVGFWWRGGDQFQWNTHSLGEIFDLGLEEWGRGRIADMK